MGSCTLTARVSNPFETPAKFLEIVQGEQKTIMFVVDPDGVFASASATAISVTFTDSSGSKIVIPNGSISRLLQRVDIQVLQATLGTPDTAALVDGIVRIEIAFDSEKARLSYSLKIVKAL